MSEGVETTDPTLIDQLLSNSVVSLVFKVVFAVMLVVVLMLVAKIVAAIVRRKVSGYAEGKEAAQVEQVANLIHDMVYYSLVIFAFFVGFEVLGFDVGLILGGVSLGIGLAFKEVLGNMISGILLLTNKDVRMGDIVQISMGGGKSYFGRIEEINLRYSVIRTFELQQVVLPNKALINATMQTFSTEKIVRLETIIQVHYDTDLDFATAVFLKAVNACSCIASPKKTKVFISGFGDSGVNMRCLFYVDPNSGLLIEQAIGLVNEKIMAYCKANNIIIPYPHTTLLMDWKDPVLLEGVNELVMKTKGPQKIEPIANSVTSNYQPST